MAIPSYGHSRAFRCLWLLEELGTDDFEVCMLTPGQPYAPQMQKYGVMHSYKIPTLQMDGHEIGDSGVISQLIAERYQENKQLLGVAAERIEMLQWLGMAETCITFRMPLLHLLMGNGTKLTDVQAQLIEPMRQVFRENVAHFESHFDKQGGDYLLDSGFSIADTMCAFSLHMGDSWGLMDLKSGEAPKTLAYLERMRARPAFINTKKYAELTPDLYGRGCVPIV
ncbi:MAG: glutathione S-transferase family protein [Cycloclasticus sp.]